MIYLDDHPQDLDLNAALKTVDQERREYALRYRREQDRRLCLAAYRLLQHGLQLEYGIREVPPFVYGANGKPSLQGHPDIHFNFSHCRDAAVCVIAPHPVGIDVECIDRYDEQLLSHTMSADECRSIATSSQPAVAFIRLWTMKESLLKLTGQGITDNLPSVLDEAYLYRFETTVTSKYICTVCTLRD